MSQRGEKELYIEPFRIPNSRLLLVLLGEFGAIFSLLIFLVTLVFIILGFFLGYRYFVLALLWIFIVVPLICFYLYIFHALKPLSAYNSLIHSLEFTNEELNITLYSPIKDKKGKKEKYDINEDAEIKDSEINDEKTFSVKDYKIYKVKKGGFGVSLFFNSPLQGMLLIPYSSFKKPSDLETLTTLTTLHLSN